MIKFKFNFPNFNYDRKKESETLRKMREYGLHAGDVAILEDAGEL